MNSAQRLEERTKSQFPLSIATSLAIEGLFGIIVDRPDPKPVWPQYTDLFINVRTLFRNLVGSLTATDNNALQPGEYGAALIEEMTIIQNIVTQYSKGRINVHFYACTYNSLTGFFPFAYFKEVNTEKQKMYALLENTSIDRVFQILGKDQSMLTRYDVNITHPGKATLLLSHYPVDLLNVRQTTELGLLESHTGAVKLRHRWNSKLYNGKDLTIIPFDKMTVQLFGDHGNLFKPYPKDIRDKVLAIAKQYKWHSATTRDRIMQSIQLAHEPLLMVMVRKLYL